MAARGRSLLRLVLLVAVPAAAVAAVLSLYLSGGRYVSAENAYVKARIVHIAPQVDGRVVRVLALNHQEVAAGQPLFEIDAEPFRAAIAEAEAELAAVERRLEALRAEYRRGEAEIDARRDDVRRLGEALERHRRRLAQGGGSRSDLAEAERALRAAGRALAAAREDNAVVLAELGGRLDAANFEHPAWRAAEARRRRAARAHAHTAVAAPMGGTLARVTVDVGEHVRAGAPVFALVATDEPWVEVNLKEVDLTHVAVGQPASVVVDAYPDIVWRAEIASIAPATGAEFQLLPPQNATGNWVKVVQRVPVRLRLLDRREETPLRAGMTVAVDIDTGRRRTLGGIVRGVLASVGGD